jgi:hypothetical protein
LFTALPESFVQCQVQTRTPLLLQVINSSTKSQSLTRSADKTQPPLTAPFLGGLRQLGLQYCTMPPVLHPNDPPSEISECIIPAMLRSFFLQDSSFPHPLISPNPSVYRLAPIPGKGIGMIATRDLHQGALIVNERPLIVVPACWPVFMFPVNGEDVKTKEDVARRMFKPAEAMLELLIARLSPENRAKFMNLHYSQEGKGRHLPLHGRYATNSVLLNDVMCLPPGVPVELLELPPEVWGYAAVCNDLSRANHRYVRCCKERITHLIYCSLLAALRMPFKLLMEDHSPSNYARAAPFLRARRSLFHTRPA